MAQPCPPPPSPARRALVLRLRATRPTLVPPLDGPGLVPPPQRAVTPEVVEAPDEPYVKPVHMVGPAGPSVHLPRVLVVPLVGLPQEQRRPHAG